MVSVRIWNLTYVLSLLGFLYSCYLFYDTLLFLWRDCISFVLLRHHLIPVGFILILQGYITVILIHEIALCISRGYLSTCNYSLISPHKSQWRGALIFSLICAWINGWVNNREAGGLRRHRAHYYVIVMASCDMNMQHCCKMCGWQHRICGHFVNKTKTYFLNLQDFKIPKQNATEKCYSDLLRMLDDDEWMTTIMVKTTDWHAFMMTSSNGNISRVIGHFCEEFTSHRWIPSTKANDAELWCFLWSAPWINGWVNNRETGDSMRHRAHYDVIVMLPYR